MAITALIAAVVAGPLANRLGHKIVLIVAGICLIVGCAIAALSGANFGILLASRIITGIGVGLCAVSASSVIAMWFPGKTRATAMAIWSTWVPVGMLIVFNGAPIVVNAFGIHVLWWIICALAIIATLLVAVFFRAPREDEAEISVQTSSLKSALPFLKSRQLIALGIAWLGFNYVNYCFVTFNVDFFQTGMGMNQSIAALIGSICSAAGIIAPLFGAVSDRINKNRKYLMIVFGCVGLLIAAAVGFQNATLSFWLFIIFQILGNSILVATCRPMAPMIVGRGGGSIEDLWAFNEEIVARAVYECSVPVISAVGHETDTTIIDFVSDLRAPTPSAAVPDMRVILGQIQGYEESLSHAMEQAVLRNRQRVENYQRIFRHLNPQSRLNDRRQRLMEIEERLRIGMNRKLDAAKSELAIRTQKLEGVSPLRQLERGYAYVSDEEGHGITSAGQVTKGQLLLLDVRDGRIESEVTAVKKRTS